MIKDIFTSLLKKILNKINKDKDIFLKNSKGWHKLAILYLVGFISIILPKIFKTLNNDGYQHYISIVVIVLITYTLAHIIKTNISIFISANPYNLSDAHMQKANTKMKILSNILIKSLIIIAAALILTTFPYIQKIGISILASAGIAGVALGLAAQKILGKVLAGIQIAFTQPIKIGDEIVIDNKIGKVEEINLTYATICPTDKRRIIVPINYFTENTFQNWTINSPDLLGVIHLEVDYTAPIQKIREALDVILQSTSLWDKKVKNLQVINLKSQTIELRILASAINSTNAHDLECILREKLIEFLQKNYPDCLPKTRVELSKH